MVEQLDDLTVVVKEYTVSSGTNIPPYEGTVNYTNSCGMLLAVDANNTIDYAVAAGYDNFLVANK